MDVITNISELIKNLETIESYLKGSNVEKNYAIGLIKRGTCFVVYEFGSRLKFAPSRFLGYKENTMLKHEHNYEKDGRVTNPVICNILENNFSPNEELDIQYQKYCHFLGIIPRGKGSFGVKRKYIKLD